jgi:thiamine monophosphate synthase
LCIFCFFYKRMKDQAADGSVTPTGTGSNGKEAPRPLDYAKAPCEAVELAPVPVEVIGAAEFVHVVHVVAAESESAAMMTGVTVEHVEQHAEHVDQSELRMP